MIVGIDISKDWFDIAWQDADQLKNQRFSYTEEGMVQLLDQLPTEAVYVMEATGTYHTRLAVKLFEAGRKVSVVNALIIKRYAQMKLRRVKSDPADAALIMQFAQHEAPPLWAPASEEVQELQQAHGWLNDLITERTRLLNRQQAHAHRAKPSPFVIKQMNRQQHQLQQHIHACEQHLEQLVKKSFVGLYERLQTIPAIGAKTALELIIITDGFTRFEEVKALCAYTGVSPTTFRSGSSVRGKGGIAKMGQGRIRQLLYVCSWTARTYNPACNKLYQRLKTAGKSPKVIGIAIAHKLLRQAFAIATKNTTFSPEFA